MPAKSLDTKLNNIRADSSCNDFILADAKDADMAFGMAAPGEVPGQAGTPARLRTLAEFRDEIRANVEQGLVDIMLMSASTSDLLTVDERLFDHSTVTPAVRVNDSSDIWLAAGGVYSDHPSLPFRSASIDHAQGLVGEDSAKESASGTNLGLYSITLNNDPEHDLRTLAAYRDFRREAERKGFQHFLEVFDPNCPVHPIPDVGRFVNDHIARTLAGVPRAARPLFLKMVYHGPRSLDELVSYDPSLVVGILGGSSGTTMDAFHQLWEAKKYGARVALYGRMINNAEDQRVFIEHLRWLADGEISDPADAVRSYHGKLQECGAKPRRNLEDDLELTIRR